MRPLKNVIDWVSRPEEGQSEPTLGSRERSPAYSPVFRGRDRGPIGLAQLRIILSGIGTIMLSGPSRRAWHSIDQFKDSVRT